MKKLETIKPETVRQGILTSLSYSSPASKGHPPRKSCCETLNPLQVLGFPEVTGIHISVPIINVLYEKKERKRRMKSNRDKIRELERQGKGNK